MGNQGFTYEDMIFTLDFSSGQPISSILGKEPAAGSIPGDRRILKNSHYK
jgi:hypothetical protein